MIVPNNRIIYNNKLLLKKGGIRKPIRVGIRIKKINMENNEKEKPQISNTPMIMGIIGGVLGIPGAFCAGACAACAGGAAGRADASSMGNFYLIIALAGAILGLVAAIKYKSNLTLWSKMFFGAAILSGFTLIAANIIALICAILFLISGFMVRNESKKLM